MTKKFNLYIGKAGHLAIMSEFLMLGWNVATPEVDLGDDIFVVQDDDGTLRRIQVKTSTATPRKNGYSCQFNISSKNLRTFKNIPVHYVFIARIFNSWSKPILIRQDVLIDYVEKNNAGSENDGNIILYFSYNDNDKIECSGLDFTKHKEDYSDFPLITH
jgi:hypothetical protein